MRRHILLARPERRSAIARQLAPPAAMSRTIKRSEIAFPAARQRFEQNSFASSPNFQADPYLDYGRYLTREGGILIIYKDLDVRLRQTLWRLFTWAAFTGTEALYFGPYAPAQSHWIEIAVLLAAGILNWLIVKKPVEVYRRIEIRPDCLIVEDSDVFWRRFMEGGFPSFRAGEGHDKILSGIYGTRLVEYLTVRRFDDNDRMSDVLAAHLQDAMRQLWTRPP